MRLRPLFVITALLLLLASCAPSAPNIVGDWVDCHKTGALFTGTFKFYKDGTLFVDDDTTLGGEYKILSQEPQPAEGDFPAYTTGEMQIVIGDANMLVDYTFGKTPDGNVYLDLMTDGAPLDQFRYTLCHTPNIE